VKGRQYFITSLYVVAFLSGFVVMAVEILGARMMAPVFGQSLFIWASVIGITLGGLTIGYFLGGFVSDRFPKLEGLFFVFLICAIILQVILFCASPLLIATVKLGLRLGSVISACIILLVPLTLLGMVSPYIIRLASREIAVVGRTAGVVYAISTFGGIAGVFITAFLLLPFSGVRATMIYSTILLCISALLCSLISKRLAFIIVSLVFVLLLIGIKISQQNIFPEVVSVYEPTGREKAQILSFFDGVNGQIKVVKYERPPRLLLLRDNIIQTRIDLKSRQSLIAYPHVIYTFGSRVKKGSNVLLMGLGGGSLAALFAYYKYKVDACEIDPRIKYVCLKYFYPEEKVGPLFKKHVNIEVDDARHYIKTAYQRNKTYDLIIFDLFNAEVIPAYLLTYQCFLEIRKILKPQGFVVIFVIVKVDKEGREGLCYILETLKRAGFYVHVYMKHEPPPPEKVEEEIREVIFFCSEKPFKMWPRSNCHNAIITMKPVTKYKCPDCDKLFAKKVEKSPCHSKSVEEKQFWKFICSKCEATFDEPPNSPCCNSQFEYVKRRQMLVAKHRYRCVKCRQIFDLTTLRFYLRWLENPIEHLLTFKTGIVTDDKNPLEIFFYRSHEVMRKKEERFIKTGEIFR
jgi:predicted membrane-bound spermidine synthase